MIRNQSITVVIPNYNGAEFIVDTVNSILDSLEEVLVIIVDDKSTDDSVSVIKSIKKSNVKLIERSINGGFAAGVNAGLAYCIEQGIEFAIIANSDIILTLGNGNDIFTQFLKFKSPDISILGFLEEGINLNRENEDISGFFFAIRLETVKTIGYLDETFYMYGEEQDFFRRIIKQGYKIVQTGIKIRHLSEKSSSSKNRNSWLAIRNSIYLESKRNKFIPVMKKIMVLFLIINKLYKPKVKDDPSLERIYRPGVLLGNYFLLSAIIWNIAKKIGVIKHAK